MTAIGIVLIIIGLLQCISWGILLANRTITTWGQAGFSFTIQAAVVVCGILVLVL